MAKFKSPLMWLYQCCVISVCLRNLEESVRGCSLSDGQALCRILLESR